MTDQELIKRAAKAAALAIHHWTDGYEDYERPVLNDGINEASIVWDPLADDGDALRLAVKLRLSILIGDRYVRALLRGDDGVDYSGREPIGNDPDAATRRAIVRAAAELAP